MTYEATGIQGEFLTYMGKPLVGEGNVIVYGDMNDAYFLQLMILTEKEVQIGKNTVKVPDGIIGQVMSTDTSLPFAKRLETYIAGGHVKNDGGRWYLTPEGFLVSNAIIGDVLDAVCEQ
jgi:hypothetical protein